MNSQKRVAFSHGYEAVQQTNMRRAQGTFSNEQGPQQLTKGLAHETRNGLPPQDTSLVQAQPIDDLAVRLEDARQRVKQLEQEYATVKQHAATPQEAAKQIPFPGAMTWPHYAGLQQPQQPQRVLSPDVLPMPLSDHNVKATFMVPDVFGSAEFDDQRVWYICMPQPHIGVLILVSFLRHVLACILTCKLSGSSAYLPCRTLHSPSLLRLRAVPGFGSMQAIETKTEPSHT
jgi:hypothetical protein